MSFESAVMTMAMVIALILVGVGGAAALTASRARGHRALRRRVRAYTGL